MENPMKWMITGGNGIQNHGKIMENPSIKWMITIDNWEKPHDLGNPHKM
jgi:hypothetical protein